ncbi:MAG: RNA chaperone Hfq [Gammaproteobacteria bacterium]|nr:RNA chaperone Hfq [Gammaproteobacteria bacterium]
MPQDLQLQNKFLQTMCNDEVPISVFLMNGIKLQGKIEAYDDHVIVLKNSTSQMIFKHAISTIVPAAATHHKERE